MTCHRFAEFTPPVLLEGLIITRGPTETQTRTTFTQSGAVVAEALHRGR